MSAGLFVNPILLPYAPYTALTGAALYQAEHMALLAGVLDANGSVTESGFDTAFSTPKGTVYAGQANFLWELDELPGSFLVGGVYSDKNFVNFAQDRRTLIGNILSGAGPDTKDGSSAYYANFSQYVQVKDKARKLGWGLFGRVGWGAEQTNAIDQFYSIGLGGKGVGERDRDRWGAGFYYTHLSSDLRRLIPGSINSGEGGVELFYSYSMTPAIHITPDVQFIFNPAGGLTTGFNDDDFAMVLGLRAHMTF